MISVFLVIAFIYPNQPPKERHRLAVASAEECVQRGQSIAEKYLKDFKPGVTVSIACEFSKT